MMTADLRFDVVREALHIALRMAENEFEMRGPENDRNYDPKAGDVIADCRGALDLINDLERKAAAQGETAP